MGRPHRVAVVDDDDLSRRGMAELLGDRPELQVLASLTHDQALDHPRWDAIDIALVDAADTRKADDQFPGVAVVEAIRQRGGDHTTIIVVTGLFFHDACRRRMREAGANFYYNRIDLHDASALYEAVLSCKEHAPAGVPPEEDLEQMFRLGVTDRTRVNEAVRYSQEHPLQDDLGTGLRRGTRAKLRYRLNFGRHARLNTVNSDGRPPERDQESPSVPQIQRFLDWATKAKGQ